MKKQAISIMLCASICVVGFTQNIYGMNKEKKKEASKASIKKKTVVTNAGKETTITFSDRVSRIGSRLLNKGERYIEDGLNVAKVFGYVKIVNLFRGHLNEIQSTSFDGKMLEYALMTVICSHSVNLAITGAQPLFSKLASVVASWKSHWDAWRKPVASNKKDN